MCPELQAWDLVSLTTNQSTSPWGRGLSDLHYLQITRANVHLTYSSFHGTLGNKLLCRWTFTR